MSGRVHVVGGGLAGLGAALAAAEQGLAVTLYEATPQAGGRCRTLLERDGFRHDNGTHVLFSANRRALDFIARIGARDRWIEPEPDGLPVYDAAGGRLRRFGLSPWSWARPQLRPDGLGFRDLGALTRLALPLPDRPVAAITGAGALTRALVEPLTVAVLNTPVEIASARRLGLALRRLLRPGAARLMVAREGLGPDLVAPALRTLAALGARILTGRRLRRMERDDDRATALVFADETIALEAQDRVVLALPPWEVARLLPGLDVPAAFEPILNAHFRFAGPERARFVGLLGTLAQWALVRHDHISVTVSSAGQSIDRDADDLAATLWGDIAPALRALGLAVDPAVIPEFRVVKERRATIRQASGFPTQTPRSPFTNLALAGDWIGSLPATIESAIISGETASRAITRGMRPRDRGAATAPGEPAGSGAESMFR